MPPDTVTVEFGRVRFQPAPADDPAGLDRYTALDPVRVRRTSTGAVLLEADRAVVWMARGGRPAGAARAGAAGDGPSLPLAASGLVVYAEGDVRFQPGPGRTIGAERLFVDWSKGVVSATGVRMRMPLASDGTPLVLAAEQLRLTYAANGADVIDARAVHLGTCEFGHPHYAVTAARVRLTGTIARRTRQDQRAAEWIALHGIGAEVFGLPIFWWPRFDWNLDWDSPIRSFEAGTSRSTGPFLRTVLGISLRQALEHDGRLERRRAGEAGIRLEGFLKRGWGAGAEARWSGVYARAPRDAFGDRPRALEFDGVGIGWRDHGDPRDARAPAGLLPLEHRSRGRVHGWARISVPAGWRVAGEGHWLSDRNVLREFAERVLKEDKEPETWAESRVTLGPAAAWLLARPRWNDFQTQTEYLPRLRGLVWAMPLWGPTAVSLDGELANVRRSFDELAGTRPYRAGRADGTAAFEARPFAWWPALARRVSFWASGFVRYSAWTRDANARGGTDRAALGARAVLRTDVYRVYGSGPGRFRHVITPELRWESVADVNRTPAELLAFDNVELLREVERIEARLRSTIQVPAGGHHRDWLLAELTAEWFPRPRRDNGGHRSGDATGELRWSPATGRLAWNTWARGTWRMPDERLSAWEAGGAWTLRPAAPDGPAWTLGCASYNVPDLVHTVTATIDCRLSARWGAAAAFRYDLERGRAQETRIVLRRVLHRWVLEGGVSVDHGDRDFTVIVSLLPLGLGGGSPFTRHGSEPAFGIAQR